MKRPEIPSLTGLRCFAAFWIVLYHYRHVLGAVWPGFPDDIAARGYLGVDVFFILSGFILAYNYSGRIHSAAEYRSFIGNRIARIYPLHLATLIAVLVLAELAASIGLTINNPDHYIYDHHLLLHLTLLHAWGFESRFSWNQPSWSISAEFFAYLLFPAFSWLASRLARPALLGIGAALSLATMVITLRALGYESLHVPMDHALVRVSGEFLAGCLLYRLYAAHAGWPRAGGLVSLLVVSGVFALGSSPMADPWMPVAAAVLIYVLARGSGPGVQLFALRPIVWLGRISYSLYLTHMIVLPALTRMIPVHELSGLDPLARVGVLALHLAVLGGVAALSYRLVEVPARGAVRRWLASPVPEGSTSAVGDLR